MPETICVSLIALGIIPFGFCFRSDQMHEQCGSILDAESGQFMFDADKLPSHVTSCNITLTSELCQDCHNMATRLMFYFTNFNMPDDCKSVNVSFLGGNDATSPSIKGLSDTLCGKSQTLLKENCVFTSMTNNISVYFTRSDVGKHHAATFSFIYSSFHIGVCDINKEVECVQGGMNHLESVCSREIDFCKNFNETICFPKSETGESSTTVKYIMCTLLGIFALYALKSIYHQYMKGEGDGAASCLSRIKMRLARTLHADRNIRLSTLIANSSVMENSFCTDPSVDRDTNVANPSQTYMDIHNAVSSEDGPVISPSAPTLGEIEGEIPTLEEIENEIPTLEEIENDVPTLEQTECGVPILEEIENEVPTLEEIEYDVSVPPPPSYDESIVPSYNEVMTHQDKYIVH